jgi:hypothetical protein
MRADTAADRGFARVQTADAFFVQAKESVQHIGKMDTINIRAAPR